MSASPERNVPYPMNRQRPGPTADEVSQPGKVATTSPLVIDIPPSEEQLPEAADMAAYMNNHHEQRQRGSSVPI